MLPHVFSLFAILLGISPAYTLDVNDWVRVSYVVASPQSSTSDSSTFASKYGIVESAHDTAQHGPWMITQNNGILPPSQNPHDYLSWAPYWWPVCNFCPAPQRRSGVGLDLGDIIGGILGSVTGTPSTTSSPPPPQTTTTSRTTLASTSTSTASTITSTTSTLTSTTTTMQQKPTAGCTPTTTTLAPSATWTTCKYEQRDGMTNPDVRNLTGSTQVGQVSQAILYNALAYGLTRDTAYSDYAASFARTFFLDPSTSMNPSLNYGQVVRGPGPQGQQGRFEGVLDLRGMTKVLNGLMVLHAVGGPSWTDQDMAGMMGWASNYVNWLQSSGPGKDAFKAPNNHGTFYVNQVGALHLFGGNLDAARQAVEGYFNGLFQDQIYASGEQPMETSRTRPFHYSCFNLEAMIANAKLGDELGLDLWTRQTRYGATIQTAVNYLLGRNPGSEPVQELLPHVAAVAAAYGDPNGVYANFLQGHDSEYHSRSYWFYDQAAALPNSPNGQASPGDQQRRGQGEELPANHVVDLEDVAPSPFRCPPIFDEQGQVELDVGVYATCDISTPPYYQVIEEKILDFIHTP